MRILGTKNKYPFSWLIRKITGESISHIVVLFDDLLCFHAKPQGTVTEWFEDFRKKNEIVHNIGLPLGLVSEEQVFFTIIIGRKKRPYDWGAIFFQFYARMRHRLFKKPMPARNKWADPNKDFCLEVLHAVPWDTLKSGLQASFDVLPLEMMSPEEIILAIKKMLEESHGTNS